MTSTSSVVEPVETTSSERAPGNVAVAAEATRVESHLHPAGSFDLAEHPVPTGLEEIWRFTPLRRLRDLHAEAPLDGDDFIVDAKAAPGVTVDSVPAGSDTRGHSGMVPRDRVSARAWAASTRVLRVDVPDETEVDEPTVVTLTGHSVDRAIAGHLVVNVGRFSTATVVVRFQGSATFADNVEIIVGDGAKLTLVTYQDWADDAVHLSAQHAVVGRDAHLKHVAVTFGGDVVRHDTTATYDGPGGSVEMLGLYFADGDQGAGQHIEHRLFVDHNAPRTTSHVVYKGALQGKGAHTVWIGNVLIRKIAEGIETFEENRNLVLTDGCQADSVPNLEIETGEIEGAGHASATGRFDDNQLFYLRSRGIEESEARRLVVHGFFNDLIRKVGVPSLADELLATVEAELAKTLTLASRA